jgi:hypothetical protein
MNNVGVEKRFDLQCILVLYDYDEPDLPLRYNGLDRQILVAGPYISEAWFVEGINWLLSGTALFSAPSRFSARRTFDWGWVRLAANLAGARLLVNVAADGGSGQRGHSGEHCDRVT